MLQANHANHADYMNLTEELYKEEKNPIGVIW